MRNFCACLSNTQAWIRATEGILRRRLRITEVRTSRKSLRKYGSLVRREGTTVAFILPAEKTEMERTITYTTMNVKSRKIGIAKEKQN